jgi:hypothetical protein
MKENIHGDERLTEIPGSRFWRHRDQLQRLGPQRIGRRHWAEPRLAGIGGHHARVPAARPQTSQQRSKTLDRQVARRRGRRRLETRRLRGWSRRHRVASPPVHGPFRVHEPRRLPRRARVPLPVVGPRARWDARPRPVGGAVVNRPRPRVDPREAPQRRLHQGQPLGRPRPGGGRQPLRWRAGPDHLYSNGTRLRRHLHARVRW